jgi:hypothetical protein
MTEQYGWVWEPEPKHLCSPPSDLRNHFERALWRCAQCDQYWEVYFNPDHGRKDMRLISPHDATARMGDDVMPMKNGA